MEMPCKQKMEGKGGADVSAGFMRQDPGKWVSFCNDERMPNDEGPNCL
jgi:hypothetical protein